MKRVILVGGRFFGILKGVVFALIITTLLSAVLAAVMYFTDVSDGVSAVLVFLIGAASCASGAYAVCKAAGSKGLVTGGAVGMIFYIVLAAASLMIKKELSLDTHMLVMLAATVLSGMLGGVLGMPR